MHRPIVRGLWKIKHKSTIGQIIVLWPDNALSCTIILSIINDHVPRRDLSRRAIHSKRALRDCEIDQTTPAPENFSLSRVLRKKVHGENSLGRDTIHRAQFTHDHHHRSCWCIIHFCNRRSSLDARILKEIARFSAFSLSTSFWAQDDEDVRVAVWHLCW